MKLLGKSQEIGEMILQAFKTGNVPAALAQSYFADPNFPSANYSASNRLIVSLVGMLRGRVYNSAGGFKYWKSIGRDVKKGEKSIQILCPLQKKVEKEVDTSEKESRYIIYGFRTVPVFDISQTSGDPIPELQDREEYIRSLPFVEVAKHWNIQVSIDTHSRGNGYYAPGLRRIGLGVKNHSTWTHELTHVADERVNGELKPGQDVSQEIVAELGGAIILQMLGYEYSADIGGCLEYIEHYSGNDTGKAIQAATRLLERCCRAVDHIVETAQELAEQPEHQMVAA